MATHIVGVDIGSTSLRAVELEGPGKARPVLTRYHEVPLPEGAVKRGEVLEVNTVAAAFKQLWAEGAFAGKKVVLGIGGQSVISRDLTVPSMPLDQIRESLQFHAQDLIPVPVEEAVLDFYPIASEPGDGPPMVRGLLIAAIKQAVTSNLTAAMEAGLNPVQMDLIPFALTRAVAASGGDGTAVAHIDVGANTTNIIICIGGVPQFVRIIPAGGDDVTRALMRRLELPREHAEDLKLRLGLSAGSTPEEHAAAEVIYGSVGELLTSVRNTLAYFSAHSPARLDTIVLSGGGSRLAGFGKATGDMTRTTVVPAEPGRKISIAPRIAKSADAETVERYSVALGLALGSAA
ncbi:type IV pilus assembly protein PilM [Lysobacter korlensis]|uniref:Type IV pilus assembly protein PilM n=1 Tax=Lysobacter korlensis TaxID=553636 RepID=A0ABV6RUR6_9GAMM